MFLNKMNVISTHSIAAAAAGPHRRWESLGGCSFYYISAEHKCPSYGPNDRAGSAGEALREEGRGRRAEESLTQQYIAIAVHLQKKTQEVLFFYILKSRKVSKSRPL